MKISEVVTTQDEKNFLVLPRRIYAGDPEWAQPLDKDINAVFDPKQNKFFRHGRCTRFLIWNDEGLVVGRIAAFINDKTSKKEKQPTGGIGFFECVNDKNVAHLLFDHAKQWLTERGMEAMDGPINFGERDSWWGLLIKGFTSPGYKTNYNPPYYRELFESYGFKTYFEQWCYSMRVDTRLQDKFYERFDKIASDPDYRAEHIRVSQLDKYAEDFRLVYNKAWARHGGGKDLEEKQVKMFFQKMKPVIDEKVIWYVYYKDEPVAMWINLPDINQLFKKFGGKFGLLQKIWFYLLLKKGKINKFLGVVFGVVPEHQGKGVDTYMIVSGAKIIQKNSQYKMYEMQWIGDFNPKMNAIAESLGTSKERILVTYRYLFDRNKPFERHPML
ncbi:MAG: hypothetical protein KA444_07585 [Bacteroidia bacterium]|nr:hypothetical protein [Bacteroidia bacterium]